MTHKPACLLHIGHSKTGTTSIQNAMAAHRHDLEARGVYYPKVPGWSNHALIPASVAPPQTREQGIHPAFWRGLPPDEQIQRFLSEFPAELNALPESIRTVVLSSEQCVFILPDDASVFRLKQLLAPHFSRIHIVVYLRRQDLHFASAYTQRLRDGVIELPAFPTGERERLEYDYARLLSRWARVFGEEAIVPRLFDRAELVGGDVVDDFLSLCNASGAVPADDKARASNPSTDAVGQALMVSVAKTMKEDAGGYRASLRDPVWREFSDFVTEERPGSGWQPPADAARSFVERFAEGNEWIRERWFSYRPGLFSAEYGKPSDDFPADDALLADANKLIMSLTARNLSLKVSQHVEIAAMHTRQKEPEKAIRRLSQAIALDETAVAPRLAIAAVLNDLGRIELAVTHLHAAAEHHPRGDPHFDEIQQQLSRVKDMPAGR